MSHRTNILAVHADYINRQGFEWLMHPYDNYHYYQTKYANSYPSLRFIIRMVLLLLLTLIPILPMLYIFTRLAVVSDISVNPLKVIAMGCVYLAYTAAIAVIGFSTMIKTAQFMLSKKMLHLPLIVPTPIIVGFAILIMAAISLYAVKQAVRQYHLRQFYPPTSTPKHLYRRKYDNWNMHLMGLYNNTRVKLKAVKQLLYDSSEIKKISFAQKKSPAQTVVLAEKAIELGKQTLSSMEDMITKHHYDQSIEKEYHVLFNEPGPSSSSQEGVYHRWKQTVQEVDPSQDFKCENISRNKLVFNVTEHGTTIKNNDL